MSAPDGRHPPIDGLRAFAAIAVLLTHVSIYSGLVAAGGDAARYAQRLEVGVAIFFVISGFVLYRPFLQARLDARELPRVGRYASRRALRIVPAYWLALTVAAVGFSLPGVLSWSGIVDLLRLRPDLLDGDVPRRARPGLDAVRGGHLLRLPAAVGVGDAAPRPGEPAPRGVGAGRPGGVLAGLEGGVRVERLARPGRAVAVAALAARLPRPLRARHGARGARRLAAAAALGAARRRRRGACSRSGS